MITIPIKNLIEKLKLFYFKRINSHNIKSEVKNQRTSISQQINNQITKQVNYNVYEESKSEKKIKNDEQLQQGQYIPIDPEAIDPLGIDIFNKVF